MSELRIRRPEEGWLPLALLLVMVVTLAWAVDDPGWVNGRRALTDLLPVCAVLGVAVGFLGPKVGWGRWTTHLVGAAFAGLLIPILSGWAEWPGSSIVEAFDGTAFGSVQAYLDVAWRGRQFTGQEVHYILVLGILMWGTAQFAAYAVFGHRRPLNAVIAVGMLLVANMALTERDQLPYLVLFTGASLFLLIGMHVFDERATWIRRRIGDPAAISALYLRGGTVFIVAALLGSMVLTQQAASAPLAGAWSSVDDQLLDLGESMSRLFPVGGDFRGGGGVRFGASARISSKWFTDQGIAFQAILPADAPKDLKWEAATYDTFVLDGWLQTGTTSVPVAAGQPVLADSAEDPSPDLTTELTVQVRPDTFRDQDLLSPGLPVSVNQDSDVLLGGQDGWYAGASLPGARIGYTVTARYLRLDDENAISIHRLEAASTVYPQDIKDRYTAVPEGAIGPDAAELLTTILEQARTTNPYDLAVAFQSYLRNDDLFTYSPDLTNVECDSPSKVECFARARRGYCLHYASTMAILLRAAVPGNPIPTRLVQGFLPGTRSGTVATVDNKAAHAWVEVYFPGYGWIPFDPTGGGVGQPAAIPEGPPVPTASPGSLTTPLPASSGRRFGGPAEGGGPEGAGSGSLQPGGSFNAALALLVVGLLGLLIVSVAFAVWVRGPRGAVNPETAWLLTTRAARRLGFAQRPTETIYEYASTLGDLVPVARSDLETVADAKVEVVYARRQPGAERLGAVRDATRRLRVSLLRLVLHRGPRLRRR